MAVTLGPGRLYTFDRSGAPQLVSMVLEATVAARSLSERLKQASAATCKFTLPLSPKTVRALRRGFPELRRLPTLRRQLKTKGRPGWKRMPWRG